MATSTPSRANLVAGVDCSTQSTKVVVIDPDDGRLFASGSAPHAVRRRGSGSETDPRQWWQALVAALAETGCRDRIASISVAAQQLGLVTLDAAGEPLRPAILWEDTRSGVEAEELAIAFGAERAWQDRVASLPRAGLTVASWAWLRRHEPDTVARVARIRLPHDFLTERLTGNAVTDRGDASGTGWWSVEHEQYASEVLALSSVGVREDQLPTVLGPDTVAGEVTPAAAQATQLPPGTMVASGTGDNMAAALALALEPGEPVISLGTSGTAYLRSTVPAHDPTGRVFAHASASGDHLPLACTLNATQAVDRVAALFGLGREDVPDRTSAVVMPYFGGERLPDYPDARATITGLDHDTTAGEILLATYQGVAASLLEALDVLDQHSSGLDPQAPLLLVGGGARGPVWRRTILALSGRDVVVPDTDDLVAWGAAAQAAAVLEGSTSSEVARRWNLRRGLSLPAMPRDDEQLARIAAIRDRADPLNRVREPLAAPTRRSG